MLKSKFFIPSAIFLTTVVLAVTGFFSVSLIQGAYHKKNLTEVKGTTISVTPIPTMTPTPIPTVEVKREPTVYNQPVEQYVAPTAIPTPIPYTINQPIETNTTNNNIPVPTAPKDSQGNLCWATASRCKYECNDPDGMIDAWVGNIAFYTQNSNLTTDPERLQYYKNEIANRVTKLTDSCGEAKVRQWVQ